MGLEDKQILISGGVIAVFGIAVIISLLITPSFSGKDTQFFVTNTVNATDISLNDLTDVLLINTLNKQILVYNSTSNLWENQNQTSISINNATCSNLGSGKILCASYSGNNLAFKSLLAGNAITLFNDTNTITITNAGVYRDIAGTGISVNQTSGSVLITNTLPESTVCNNATSSAGHKGLCKDNVIDLRTLLAGSGISLSLNSTDITITNSGIISNSCDTGINCSGSNPATFNTDFVNGTGIRITGSTSQTFTNTGVTSITASSPLSVNASTGAVSLSCSTCITSTPVYNYESCYCQAVGAGTRLGGSTTYYFVLQGTYGSGQAGRSTTESDVQGFINKNIHILQIDIRIRESSGNSGTFTFAFRDDSSDVCNFTLTNNSVGIQSNTCNTAVASGSLINFRVTTGTANTFSPTTFVVWYTLD